MTIILEIYFYLGYVLDRKLTECKKNPKKQLVADDSRLDTELDPLFKKVAETNEDDSENTYERVQKLRNTRDAYIITVVSKDPNLRLDV